MIHEVDETIRSIVRRDVINGSDIEVVFDAPTKDWASRRNSPTIDIYLYDIREDLKRRTSGNIDMRNDAGRVTGRRPIPRSFKLSYLITAWTQRPEDEHRLLSSLLMCFLARDSVPKALLTGRLAELQLPVPLTVALPPPEDRSFADVWTALGGELKPSLDIVVSAPVDAAAALAAGPPAREGLSVDLSGVDGDQTDDRVGHHVAAEPDEDTRVAMRRTRRTS